MRPSLLRSETACERQRCPAGMLPTEWRLCTQCVRRAGTVNDRGISIFVKRLETFVLSAL